jgi:hypothetical protein
MSKPKKPSDKKPRGNYDQKLKVNGSFLQLIQTVVKHAKQNEQDKSDPKLEE